MVIFSNCWTSDRHEEGHRRDRGLGGSRGERRARERQTDGRVGVPVGRLRGGRMGERMDGQADRGIKSIFYGLHLAF